MSTPEPSLTETAALIAKLAGYLNVASGDVRFQSAVNSEGEVVAYKLGLSGNEFLSIARQAAQEALRKTPSAVRAFCQEHLPLLLKQRHLAGSEQWQVTNWNLIAASDFTEPAGSSAEANARAKCPSCGAPAETMTELRKEATGGLRPAAIICGGCRKNISYDEYLRFNGVVLQ